MQSDLVIRRAEPGDAAAVSAFARRIFDLTFGPDNDPADMRAYTELAFSPEAQGREIADPSRIMLLAERGGVIAAYTTVRVGSTEPSVRSEAPVEIERFYVDQALHGQGVAGRLMDVAIETARAAGGRTVWLGVWERNARAIRFYEKCGFTDVGAHEFLLGRDRQTDRVMARPIDESGAPR